MWNIRERLLEGPESSEREKQLTFFQETYFFPLHERIREILATKLHLVDGGIVPPSFNHYLEHAMQQLIQYQLEAVIGVSTAEAPDVPWPKPFHSDLEDALHEIQARADRYLRDLEPGDVYRRDGVTAGAGESPP